MKHFVRRIGSQASQSLPLFTSQAISAASTDLASGIDALLRNDVARSHLHATLIDCTLQTQRSCHTKIIVRPHDLFLIVGKKLAKKRGRVFRLAS